MDVLYPRCAGLDVHAETVVACVRISWAGLCPRLDDQRARRSTRTPTAREEDVTPMQARVQRADGMPASAGRSVCGDGIACLSMHYHGGRMPIDLSPSAPPSRTVFRAQTPHLAGLCRRRPAE
jgi:hypothetical protein